jgi:hypothetical protein
MVQQDHEEGEEPKGFFEAAKMLCIFSISQSDDDENSPRGVPPEGDGLAHIRDYFGNFFRDRTLWPDSYDYGNC